MCASETCSWPGLLHVLVRESLDWRGPPAAHDADGGGAARAHSRSERPFALGEVGPRAHLPAGPRGRCTRRRVGSLPGAPREPRRGAEWVELEAKFPRRDPIRAI